MRNSRTRRVAVFQMLAVVSAILALPLASQAAVSTTTGKPTVITGAAHVTGTTAVLDGTVNPHNLATTYYFQYGPTKALGQQTPSGMLPAGSTTVKVSQTVTGFLPGYHYRLVASNSAGSKSGHEREYKPKTKAKKNGFVLPKTFAPTPIGGTFILSGTLQGSKNAERAIVLQANPYPYRGAYVNVGLPVLTGPTGAFTFRVANMQTSTKFRVITVGAGAPVTSLIVPEQVQVRVVLKARSSGHPGLVRLYGTVTPAEVGAHVLVQLEKPPNTEKHEGGEKPGKLEKPGKHTSEKPEKGPTYVTKFKTVVKRATKAISRFSIVVKVPASGNYRVFVEVPSGPLVSGHSATVTIHAAAKAKKKKTKR